MCEIVPVGRAMRSLQEARGSYDHEERSAFRFLVILLCINNKCTRWRDKKVIKISNCRKLWLENIIIKSWGWGGV